MAAIGMVRGLFLQLGLAVLYVVLAVAGLEKVATVATYLATKVQSGEFDELFSLDLDVDVDLFEADEETASP